MSTWVVKSKIKGKEQSHLWDTKTPLGLGHPFRWILEKTKSGIRVRDIQQPDPGYKSSSPWQAPWTEISFEELEKDPKKLARLTLTKDVEFEVRKATTLQPAFLAPNHSEKIYGFQIYAHRGPWIVSNGSLTPSLPEWVAHSPEKKPLFRLIQTDAAPLGSKVKLSFFETSFRDQKGRIFSPNSFVDLTLEELAQLQLVQAGGTVWTFVPLARSAEAAESALQIRKPKDPYSNALRDEALAEQSQFKRQITYGAGALGLLLLFSWVVPQFFKSPVEEKEVLPDQYAKIIFTPRKATPSASNQGAVAENKEATSPSIVSKTDTPAQKKAKSTAVVQAFRAQALQNSVSGLLKGGMTKLLEQSEFVMGKNAAQDAKRMFDTKQNGLVATGPEVGNFAGKNVAVSQIGGGSANGTGAGGTGTDGKSVGYGKGTNAALQGQGKGFVSMDLGNTTVDEGLSKDEVGEVIHRHLSEVRYCYESAMVRQPDVEGKLMIHFVIGGVGKVKSAEVTTSTLPDPRLDDCVLRRLMTWKFPVPKGGIDVSVNYPFIFKTLGR